MAKVSEYKGTTISTVAGMSGHTVRLTVSQSSTTSGATGSTVLTWRLYYELSSAAAAIQTSANRSTTFKLAGKTITSNWNLGGTFYSGPGYVELGTGTVTINRTLSNAEPYNITGQITSTHILTGTNSWSSGKGPGTTGSYTINAVTLATNITGPTSFIVDKNRIAFKTNTLTTFSWSGQASGTNNAIGMTLQYKWRNADWADWSEVSGDSKEIIWGEGGDWTDFNEGEVIQFRIKAIGATLKDTQYSSTIEIKVNNVPTLNPIVKDNNYISSEENFITKKEFEFNANDLNGDKLSYYYKIDDGNWITQSTNSLSLTFGDQKGHTVYFKVEDEYNDISEEKSIDLLVNEQFSLDPDFIFETPDNKNPTLTKKLIRAEAGITGGTAPYEYSWTIKYSNDDNDDDIFPFSTTDSIIQDKVFPPRGAEIKYSLTVKDYFGVVITKEDVSTGYFTPSEPLISSLEISKDHNINGIDGFYNGFKYNYKIGEGDTFATIDKYDFIVYRKDGEKNIELKATHNEADKVFNFESRGTNKHFLELTITDAFGQTAKAYSGSLNRLYHLNELFIENSNNWNSITPNPFKPLSNTNLTFNGSLGYNTIFSDGRENQGLSIEITAFYNNTDKTEILEGKDAFDNSKSLISFSVPNDSGLFNKTLNKSFNCVYKIAIKNQFGDSFSLSSVEGIIDYREPSSLINASIGGWKLNELEEGIKANNNITTKYYLSYGDKIDFSSIMGEENSNISDLNGNGIETVLSSVEAYFGKDLVSGTFNKGIWTNLNRLDTKEGIIFKATLTDSTGLTYEQEISTNNCVFYACRSTYPKLRVNTVGGETGITFTVEDYGDDETCMNYRHYYEEQTLKSDSALFEGLIYRGHEGYNEEKSIQFNFSIKNITANYDPNFTPNILYCTYDPVMNLASGIQYTDIPNLTWVWFGEAPTISPRKNRMGINIKAENMDEDILLQINMANENRQYIKLVGLANKGENNIGHELVMDLFTGRVGGFIIDGGTWD